MTPEEKAKAYDKAIEKIKYVMEHGVQPVLTKEDLQSIFPELQESEDEKVKRIIHSISNKISFHLHDIFTEEEFQCFDAWSNAWLKKQNKHQQLYIRFGNIPSNEKSKIYRGEEEIGYENGVSVYPAFEDVNGNIVLGLSLPITKTTLYTQQHLIEYDDRLCYLVKGDYVGKGTDGEPLIKNVRIIKEIKPYRMKQDKENNIYIINNTPNCSISVYNEELKESEDERIRKALIKVFSNREKYLIDQSFGDITVSEALAWLEKQGNVNALIQEAAEKSYTEGMRVERKRWLEKQGEQNLASSAKISKNEDTLLDLLHKMPPFITVDGIDYHFVMAKHSYYIAYYKAIGEEGSGNAIFGAMAFSPIDLLTEMLEILKKKGLLE